MNTRPSYRVFIGLFATVVKPRFVPTELQAEFKAIFSFSFIIFLDFYQHFPLVLFYVFLDFYWFLLFYTLVFYNYLFLPKFILVIVICAISFTASVFVTSFIYSFVYAYHQHLILSILPRLSLKWLPRCQNRTGRFHFRYS